MSLNQVKGIDRFEDEKFVLKDNSTVTADVLLFCTGYKYVYPFLDNNAEITVDDDYVSPVYKHTVSVEHPSMSFIGIPDRIPIFAVCHTQVCISIYCHKIVWIYFVCFY